MRRIFVLGISLFLAWNMSAQEKGYEFSVVKENPVTSIKNQANSGTCWSFSGVGFLESELIRMKKGEHDLSDMYIVRRNYADKAMKYVRTDGHVNFSQGGSFADVIETLGEYGVLPEESYNGLNYGETTHKHSEMEKVLSGYVNAISSNPNKKLSSAWFNGFNAVLDAYLGALPGNVAVGGKTYSAQEYAKYLGLDANNYISLTSYTHHPFYTPFALEIADNWRWALSYNVPIDELMEVIDNALNSGYTIAWATDVSEVGFTRDGLAVIPDENDPENVGSDQAHWLGLSQTEKNNKIKTLVSQGPVKEKTIDQEMRQIAFDNKETTDDHGMQIFGIAKDQNGKKYYMVKNSWGETGKYKGIWYASEAFVKYKTMSIVINKESLPKATKSKLNLK